MRWSSKARPQHFVLCELGQLFLTKSREKRSTCSIALISSGKNSLRGKDFFVKVRTCATTISKIFIHSCGFRVFPRYSENLRECAHWLVTKLSAIGLEAQLVSTAGHPVVWARNKPRQGRRTVLIYGHYDVQPPDPLDLWESPPFEPVLKDGFVFARGATDNKGQILSHILGVQEKIERAGELPVNVHFVIEGEEEIGSGNLGNFLQQNRDALKCDVVVVSDTGMIARLTPTLSYGLRGVAALEVKVTGAKMDLHSGIYGGAVANPAAALAQLLTTLHDREGHITIEGFYDDVAPLQDWERDAWKKLPVDVEAEILKETGAPSLFGEAGFSVIKVRERKL